MIPRPIFASLGVGVGSVVKRKWGGSRYLDVDDRSKLPVVFFSDTALGVIFSSEREMIEPRDTHPQFVLRGFIFSIPMHAQRLL